MRSSRREFLQASTAMALPLAYSVTRPRFGRQETIIGEGDFQFRVDHQCVRLPDKYHWQTTHNVAVDSANRLYVIHEGRKELKDHPSIFVFDPDGKFVRAMGCQFQGGGHGLEIRREGSEEFIYVAAYQQVKAFSKLTLDGETVWYKKAPMESGVYAPGEDTSTRPSWNRKGFLPTNFAFLKAGGFLLADGYGSYFIHQFDQQGTWVRCFGGPGTGQGTFNTSHGLWVDCRPGREPSIVVTDRARHTVQILNMDGQHLQTLEGFGLPANVDTYDKLMIVPELKARVTLLNDKNEMVAQLGDGNEQLSRVKDLRQKPKLWKAGQFVHPHDACFDRDGNIFVAEWVQGGRITKLTRV